MTAEAPSGRPTGDSLSPRNRTRIAGSLDSTMVSVLLSDLQPSMIAIPNPPPYGVTQVDDFSASGTTESTLSDYEKLFDEQGFLPRIEDQYDWSGRGMHVEYGKNDEVPLQYIRGIGATLTSTIEAVKCRGRLLARKSITISKRIKKENLITEIGCLQSLRHRHIVQVLGSYTDEKTLYILQYPVADCDLKKMMKDMQSCHVSKQDDRIAVKRFFSCLAQAVKHIHEELIRHGDIKPSNILVRRPSGSLAQVYITDFGTSQHYLSKEEAEIDGLRSMTPRYAAPEVHAQKTHGFPADIFSLGCVFLEMQAAVLGPSYFDLDMPFRDSVDGNRYCANEDAINAWIERLNNHPRSLEELQIPQCETRSQLKIVKAMLNHNPAERPLAVDIALSFGTNECCHLDREGARDEAYS
jgi:serine/threonine protein kinase